MTNFRSSLRPSILALEEDEMAIKSPLIALKGASQDRPIGLDSSEDENILDVLKHIVGAEISAYGLSLICERCINYYNKNSVL